MKLKIRLIPLDAILDIDPKIVRKGMQFLTQQAAQIKRERLISKEIY